MQSTQSSRVFSVTDIRRFVEELLQAAKVREDVARALTDSLLFASLRGIDSHGIRLLPHYLAAVEGGRIQPNPNYQFKKTGDATGLLDADHTFGHAAGKVAVEKAVSLAKGAGVGGVGVFHSSHSGAASFFALEMARQEMIGLSFTHANSLLNTPGSTRAFFGLNPIAMAVPCEGEAPFCFDSTPSILSWNKLLMLHKEGKPAPAMSGADASGEETQDSDRITQLLPVGGYKGFGLAMMVDILCGLLTGMPVGREITDMYKTELSRKRNLGQFYLAIRIEAFQPLAFFKQRMKDLMEAIRNEPCKNPAQPVMVPGDPEKKCEARRREEGIPIPDYDLENLKKLAEKYRVSFLA